MTALLPIGTAVLIVQLEVDPEFEDELQRWMNDEHIPLRMGYPGFLSVRRFKLADVVWPGTRHLDVAAGRTYVTIYELENLEALESPEYLSSYNELTEWSTRVSPHQRDVIRSVYTTIHTSTSDG